LHREPRTERERERDGNIIIITNQSSQELFLKPETQKNRKVKKEKKKAEKGEGVILHA